ncbi:MAG: DUF5615 family PIN-like protein [Candidatus Riflebacteria bacterium]|nr:DUF5615 family PIN-like protein [Candidatus Riflebacteria bacterium]
MRFLANENFPGEAIHLLREAGHDVAWICRDSPGASDQAVLSRAVSEARVLLTFDKDFGELACRSQLPKTSGVVLFRISMRHPPQAVRRIVDFLISRDSWEGLFAVIEESRIRVRPLP